MTDPPPGVALTVSWQSFLLRPEPEQRTMEAFTDYTRSWARPAGLEPGAPFATPWSGANAPPTHSLPAAVAAKVAASFGEGASTVYRNRVFAAYFVENLTVSDPGVLAELAEQSGLDRDEFEQRRTARETELVRQVYREHVTGVQSGVTGVPAVAVNRRYLLPGAMTVQDYRRAIEQVLSEDVDPARS